jgi:hypothetical protein
VHSRHDVARACLVKKLNKAALQELSQMKTTNRTKVTVSWCPDCEAGLCVEGYFKIFCTKLKVSGKILLYFQTA